MKHAIFEAIITVKKTKQRRFKKPEYWEYEYLTKIYLQDPRQMYVSEMIDSDGKVLQDRCTLKYYSDVFTIRGSFQSIIDKIESLKMGRDQVGGFRPRKV